MSTMDTLGKFKKPKLAGQTPFTDTYDRCERLGYVPTHKRIAQLISAGLNLQVARDELWDVISDNEALFKDLPAMPPLRRHLDADLADLSQMSREYAARKRVVEERLREHVLERRAVAKVTADAQASGVVQPSAGQGAAPQGGEAPPQVGKPQG
ncbi:MAG: hypothetical protein [Microviridae sp.]|nr:MAG: hypothetical protein [Microviridae sp.]